VGYARRFERVPVGLLPGKRLIAHEVAQLVQIAGVCRSLVISR
jgi:hypothetical protein